MRPAPRWHSPSQVACCGSIINKLLETNPTDFPGRRIHAEDR